MDLPEDLLNRIEGFLERHEDVRYGGDGNPLPNESMLLLMELRAWRLKGRRIEC